MSNGCTYLMVFLPNNAPDTFLMFVEDAHGNTSLRDYSDGRMRNLPSAPTIRELSRQTEYGRTRFEIAEIRRKEDVSYWQSVTRQFNERYLSAVTRQSSPPTLSSLAATPTVGRARKTTGQANRGSQRQLQDYVNLFQPELKEVILSKMPDVLRNASIRWISPLEEDDYREYQDEDFLRAVGLDEFKTRLGEFWPPNGPCWDGLALLQSQITGAYPVVLLVEAKSHIPEMRSIGCQASEASLAKIRKALEEARKWCGATPETDWTGPLYQSANRIAHLYFVRHWLNRPCYLVNLYFVDDPYRPTSVAEWEKALEAAHDELGLDALVPGLLEVFLPGKPIVAESACAPSAVEVSAKPSATSHEVSPGEPKPPSSHGTFSQASTEALEKSFAAWFDQWHHMARFHGSTLPDAENRIQQVLELWDQPIPGKWKRGIDLQLLGGVRYRRGDLHAPHQGEHAIEHQILVERFGNVSLLGAPLIDGVDAFPLACDFAGGGRRGNVEADLLLLSGSSDGYRLALCEVKANADDPWFAAVESLRQMRLFLANPGACKVMVERGMQPAGSTLSVTGLVLAPADYYRARGKKCNALAPARLLFHQVRKRFEVDMRLAVWDAAEDSIHEFEG